MTSFEDLSQPNEILRLKARIIEGMADVMDGLLASRVPDHLQTDCYYYPFIRPIPFDMPFSISQYGEDIDHLSLTFQEEPESVPTASLEICFDTNPMRTLHISTDPNEVSAKGESEEVESAKSEEEKEEKLTDAIVISIPHVTDRNVTESTQTILVEQTPPEDIYRVVMGMVTGHNMSPTTHELTRFEAFWPYTHQTLLQSIKAFSHTWNSHYSYVLEGERKIDWTISSSPEGEETRVCQLIYETGTPGRTVVATLYPSEAKTFNLEIRDNRYIDVEDGKHNLEPDLGDWRRLEDVVNELRTQYRKPRVISAPLQPLVEIENPKQ